MLYNVAAGSGEFNEQYSRYRIKKIERETIWGSISADNYHENTVVLSDKRFEEEKKRYWTKQTSRMKYFCSMCQSGRGRRQERSCIDM